MPSRPHSTVERSSSSDQIGSGTCSVLEVSFNILNCTVGSGILALSFAIKECGFGLGIVLSAVVAILCWLALNTLIITGKRINVYKYAMLTEATMGSFGFYLLNGMIFFQTAGACITYMIVIGDTIPVILELLGYSASREWVIFISSLIFILPLLFYRSIGSLARASMISVMTLPPILAIVALRGFHYAPDHKRSYDFVGDNVFPAIGVMAFAMLSAQTAFLNFTTLAQPTRKAWGQATGIAVFFSWIISFVFAIIGFIAFGEDVQPNIFNSFPSTDDLINIGRILLGFSMFLTVPQAFYPARASLHKVLGHEDNFKSPTDTEHVYTTIGLFFPILACGVFVADLGLLYQLIGGFCSTFLAYIIPGACYIIVFWSKDGGQSLRERIRQEQAQWEQKSEGLGISPSSSNGSLTNASYSGTVLEQGQDRFEDSSEEEEGASVTFDNDDEEEDQAFLRKKLAAERQHDPAHAEHGISTQKQRQGKARSPPIGYNPKDSTTEPLLKDNRLSGSYGALSSLPNSPSSTSSASSAGSNTISPISGQGSSRRKTELWLDVSAVVLLVFGTFVMVVATTITLRRMLGYS